jgi:hypothetical protein
VNPFLEDKNMKNIVFRKTGEEIKEAIQNRQKQLQQRLDKRNESLNALLEDPKKVRSYIVRNSQPNWGHRGEGGYVLYSQDDISSEEMEEIAQLCRRIFEIEQELSQLGLVITHLDDDQVFNLDFQDLIGYGFEVNTTKVQD